MNKQAVFTIEEDQYKLGGKFSRKTFMIEDDEARLQSLSGRTINYCV